MTYALRKWTVPTSLHCVQADSLAPSAQGQQCEQMFSRSGELSDNNGKMDPAHLAVWASIGINYSTFRPSNADILTRYLLKFSKGSKGKVHEDDLGLLDGEATGSSDSYYVQAGES